MGLHLRLELKLQNFNIAGSITCSIFPEVEVLLSENSDYREALAWVAYRKKMRRYCSMIDFLFCGLFPKYKYRCSQYYKGEGASLKQLITAEEIQSCNDDMLKALRVALDIFQQKRIVDWVKFRFEFHQVD